jgi:hypothetical protein
LLLEASSWGRGTSSVESRYKATTVKKWLGTSVCEIVNCNV